MAKLDLSKYGITGATEVLHNPSYEVLFEEEIKCNPLFDEETYKNRLNELYEIRQSNLTDNAHQPKCTMCGSTNIHKISGVKRATHGLAFGLFSKTARSQCECGNCHNKW